MVSKNTPSRPERHRKRLASRENAVVTSIILPDPLHRRAALEATRRDWSLTELFRVAVEEWLTRHEGKGGGR